MRERTEALQLAAHDPRVQRGNGTAAVRSGRASSTVRLVNVLQRQGLLLLLLALVIYMWQASPFFMTVDNLLSIGGIAGALGIMAVAQTLLVVSGGLDISVGSVIAVSGVTLVVITQKGMDIWLAVPIVLAIGVAVGALNGLLVVALGVNPLIATLGTMSILQGLAFMISSGGALSVNDAAFNFLGTGAIAGIPTPFVLFLGVWAFALLVERMTTFGRAVFAIGGNREAARLAGLRVDRVPFLLYVISGLSAAVAGLVLTSQLGASSPDVGSSYTLSVITAVILGGASLAGGRGTVVGTLLAVLFLGVLQNGFTLLQISSYAQTLILGVALIFAVLVDQTARRMRSKGMKGERPALVPKGAALT